MKGTILENNSRLHKNDFISYSGSFSRWGGLKSNCFYFVSVPLRKHLTFIDDKSYEEESYEEESYDKAWDVTLMDGLEDFD